MESINTDSEQILDLERGTCVTTEESTGIVALEFIHHLYAHVYITGNVYIYNAIELLL